MTRQRKTLLSRLHGMMFKLPLMITCDAFESFILAYLEDELIVSFWSGLPLVTKAT